ncbi:MAG: hypothetical protein AAF563_02845 [Pseudomonadota bacterium]
MEKKKPGTVAVAGSSGFATVHSAAPKASSRDCSPGESADSAKRKRRASASACPDSDGGQAAVS